jgi:hypothetical protein
MIIFNKILSLQLIKYVNFKVAITAMYPWIPLGTVCRSLGIHGNQCHKDYGCMRCDTI